MISIHESIEVSDITDLPLNNVLIEATSVTLTLPNHSQLQVTLVYRSPSVPTSTFLEVMSTILTHLVTHSMPNLILGDFNEDLIAHPNSQLLSLVSSYGFIQMVNCPTTDSGSLLDHIYYNRPCDQLNVQVVDAYYSDMTLSIVPWHCYHKQSQHSSQKPHTTYVKQSNEQSNEQSNKQIYEQSNDEQNIDQTCDFMSSKEWTSKTEAAS